MTLTTEQSLGGILQELKAMNENLKETNKYLNRLFVVEHQERPKQLAAIQTAIERMRATK